MRLICRLTFTGIGIAVGLLTKSIYKFCLFSATVGTSATTNSSCVRIVNASTQAIVIDLGNVKTIGNVYISMEDNSSYLNAGLTFSTDNATYTSGVTISAPDPAKTARYIKLINGASGSSTYDQSICQIAFDP